MQFFYDSVFDLVDQLILEINPNNHTRIVKLVRTAPIQELIDRE